MLCQLLAVSVVVYADETSWSINSVWAFQSDKARVTIHDLSEASRRARVDQGPNIGTLCKLTMD